MKKWILRERQPDKAAEIATVTGLSPLLCDVLASRGIDSIEKADEMFQPVAAADTFGDPFELKDMEKAVTTVQAAITANDPILIFGDYDCDGITATVMLVQYLEAAGADVRWYIPTRTEGYGLNTEALQTFVDEGVKLVITVDNGISANTEAEFLQKSGVKLVITDHHQPSGDLPTAEAIVNPHQADDTSLFKATAGCVVALKLIAALEGNKAQVAEEFGVLAALGTIADVMPLTDFNRRLVRFALPRIEHSENLGLCALLKEAGASGTVVDINFLSYKLIPMINSAGRFTGAEIAANLLLSDDPDEAKLLAKQLKEINVKRREVGDQIAHEAERHLSDSPERLSRRVLLLSGEGWHQGVIGIVAGKLLEKHGKPVLVVTTNGEDAKGSARSNGGLSIYPLLTACSEALTRYGGHSRAGGFSLKTADIPRFEELIDKYCDDYFESFSIDPTTVDALIKTEDITVNLLEQLQLLQPCGAGNPEPLFMLKGLVISSVAPLKNGAYISVTFTQGGKSLRALCFRMGYDSFAYHRGDKCDVLVSLFIDDFAGRGGVSAIINDIRLGGVTDLQDRYAAAEAAYEEFSLGKTPNEKLLERITPDSATFRRVFDLLKSHTLRYAEEAAFLEKINVCRFRVAVDILKEAGIIAATLTNGRAEFLPQVGKADLSDTPTSKRLAASLSII
ncbi:MAG: single-stranded-DNA-specific exonuclease RecJ [Oscillospiraceae bacterium]|jgi:single-stranded-DNA-specific exonuclease|nr:single-stranded-DNA-specific exonuclease RecJ [Oscillospiraceae bacterium]